VQKRVEKNREIDLQKKKHITFKLQKIPRDSERQKLSNSAELFHNVKVGDDSLGHSVHDNNGGATWRVAHAFRVAVPPSAGGLMRLNRPERSLGVGTISPFPAYKCTIHYTLVSKRCPASVRNS